MRDKNQGHQDPDDENQRELINLEFESMVEGLSLDESAPTSYLDELDRFDKANSFIPPTPQKLSFRESLLRAKISFKKWRNSANPRDDDGSAI